MYSVEGLLSMGVTQSSFILVTTLTVGTVDRNMHIKVLNFTTNGSCDTLRKISASVETLKTLPCPQPLKFLTPSFLSNKSYYIC